MIDTIKWDAFAGDKSLKVSFKARVYSLKLQLQRDLFYLWDRPDDLPQKPTEIKTRSGVSGLASKFNEMKV